MSSLDNTSPDVILSTKSDIVTISITKYIDDISNVRFNKVHPDTNKLKDNTKPYEFMINDSLEFPSGNPEYTALSTLREYKNREGDKIYDNVYKRTLNGRERRKQINFSEFSYEMRQMRRKAEVLKYKNFGINDKIRESKSNKKSQYQLKLLKEINKDLLQLENQETCDYNKFNYTSIIIDNSVPFLDKL